MFGGLFGRQGGQAVCQLAQLRHMDHHLLCAIHDSCTMRLWDLNTRRWVGGWVGGAHGAGAVKAGTGVGQRQAGVVQHGAGAAVQGGMHRRCGRHPSPLPLAPHGCRLVHSADLVTHEMQGRWAPTLARLTGTWLAGQ